MPYDFSRLPWEQASEQVGVRGRVVEPTSSNTSWILAALIILAVIGAALYQFTRPKPQSQRDQRSALQEAPWGFPTA